MAEGTQKTGLILSSKAVENTLTELKSDILTLASKHEDTDWEFEAFKLNVLRALEGETALKCTLFSMRQAVIEACRYGFMPNTSEGLCYLIPYWSNKINAYELHFQLGYKGIATLMYRMNIAPEAWPVYEADLPNLVFNRTEKGTVLNFPVRLYKSEEERGAVLGAIASLKFLDKDYSIIQPVDLAYIEKIKASLRAKNRDKKLPAVWDTHLVEMIKKTAVIYGSKLLPRQDTAAAKMLMSAIRADSAPLRDDEVEREELMEGEGFTVVGSEPKKQNTKAAKATEALRASKDDGSNGASVNANGGQTENGNEAYKAFYALVEEKGIEIKIHKAAKDAATKDGTVDWAVALENLKKHISGDGNQFMDARANFVEWLRKFEEAGKTQVFNKAFLSEMKAAPNNVSNEQLEAANKFCVRMAKSLNIE